MPAAANCFLSEGQDNLADGGLGVAGQFIRIPLDDHQGCRSHRKFRAQRAPKGDRCILTHEDPIHPRKNLLAWLDDMVVTARGVPPTPKKD